MNGVRRTMDRLSDLSFCRIAPKKAEDQTLGAAEFGHQFSGSCIVAYFPAQLRIYADRLVLCDHEIPGGSLPG